MPMMALKVIKHFVCLLINSYFPVVLRIRFESCINVLSDGSDLVGGTLVPGVVNTAITHNSD